MEKGGSWRSEEIGWSDSRVGGRFGWGIRGVGEDAPESEDIEAGHDWGAHAHVAPIDGMDDG